MVEGDPLPPGLSNGALATYELLKKLDGRLDTIEGRLLTLEKGKPKSFSVPQVISQCIAGLMCLGVIGGAIVGKLDIGVALAFAGGLAFSLPGLASKGGAS